MNRFQRFASAIVAFAMLVSCIPAFAAQDGADSADIFINENFNSAFTGSSGGTEFTIKKVGEADVGVVEKPDSINKSLYLRSSASSSVSVVKEVVNPNDYPLTLSFRFMIPNASQSFSFPRISDSTSRTADVLTLQKGELILNGEKSADVTPGIWHWAEIKFNTDSKYMKISLDGVELAKKISISLKDISYVSFVLEDKVSELYIDDVLLARSSAGGNGREYYPSEIFLSDDEQEEVEDVLLGSLTMFVNSNVAYKNGTRLNLSAAPLDIDKEIYVPLRFIAETLGAEVVWNGDEQAAFVIFGGKTIKLTPESSTACIDGTHKELKGKVTLTGGSTYIHADDIASLLNQEVYSEETGFVLIGDPTFYKQASADVKNEVMHMVKYNRPTGEQMYNAVLSANPDKTHPRFYGNKAEFTRLAQSRDTDLFAASCLNALTTEAEQYLQIEPFDFVIGNAAGTDSRLQNDDLMFERIKTLGFMYQITGNEDYAKRCWKEMENIAKFPHWNPSHYLDTGVMSEALALGFDYIYDYMTEAQKKTIRDALVEKSLRVALSVYRGSSATEYPELNPRIFWIGDPFNWNAHCNMGTLQACLAICDEPFTNNELEEVIIPCMSYAMRSLEIHFDEWTPDGAWQEGPGYGSGTLTFDAQILDNIITNCGTDFGYASVPGLAEACSFFFYMQGPQGTFNYSDGGQMKDPQFDFEFWMAEQLDKSGYAADRIEQIKGSYYESVDPTELLWYDPQNSSGSMDNMELDKYFRKAEVAVMRSNWEDDGMYAGFYAGDNDANHSQLDTGTHILDWNNVRWVTDLGYDGLSYGNEGVDYVTYRARGEGHNTIVIDNTPYADNTLDNGWIQLITNDFDSQEIGQTPIGFTVSEAGPVNKPSGSVRIVKSANSESENNQALRIHSPSNESGTQAYALLKLGEPKPSHSAEVSFKLNAENIGVDTPICAIYGDKGQSTPFIRLKPDGKMYAYNGSSTQFVISDYKLDTWYDIKLVVNFQNQTYNLYIDGELICNNWGFQKLVENMNSIRFQISAREATILLDDFTVNVHPDDAESYYTTARKYDQNVKGKAYIDEFVSKPRGAFVKSDLTDAYRDWANSFVRGAMLGENRNTYIIRDELKLKGKSDVYWFSHSASDIDIMINSDGKSAILSAPDGSRMWVGMLTDTDAVFEEMAAKPLPGSPDPAKQNANTAFHKLAIKFTGIEELNFSVAYVPLGIGETEPQFIPEEVSLKDWSVPDGEIPKLDTITVNGEEILGFAPDKLTYNITLEETDGIPDIRAYADGKELEVKQAVSAPGSATFSYTSGSTTLHYIISFTVRNVLKSSIQGYPITEDDITTSSFQQEANPPSATIDGNNTTRWAAEGIGQWIIYDFGQLRSLSELKVGWFKGDTRRYEFEIQLSKDGASWTTVYSGTNSGTTAEPETYSFETQDAQYIKIVGKGNNEIDPGGARNLWNNLAEVQ